MKHPLQMTAQERAARKAQAKARMREIEDEVRTGVADPTKPNVYPDLEHEWGKLKDECDLIANLESGGTPDPPPPPDPPG